VSEAGQSPERERGGPIRRARPSPGWPAAPPRVDPHLLHDLALPRGGTVPMVRSAAGRRRQDPPQGRPGPGRGLGDPRGGASRGAGRGSGTGGRVPARSDRARATLGGVRSRSGAGPRDGGQGRPGVEIGPGRPPAGSGGARRARPGTGVGVPARPSGRARPSGAPGSTGARPPGGRAATGSGRARGRWAPSPRPGDPGRGRPGGRAPGRPRRRQAARSEAGSPSGSPASVAGAPGAAGLALRLRGCVNTLG